MYITLAEAKKDGKTVYLSQYVDFHKYEIFFIITVATPGISYREYNAKTFATACKTYNKICNKNGLTDFVIW